MSEAKFLKLAAGFLNPDAVRWAEDHEKGLVVSVAGKERPILLQGQDARRVELCLLQRLVSLPEIGEESE